MVRVLLIAAASILAVGPAKTPAQPTAQQIIQRMGQTYASCKSYRDTGTVTSVYHEPQVEGMQSVTHFQTAFARPDRFRFGYSTSREAGVLSDRMIVWTSKGKVHTWWNVEPKVTTEESLSMAIAGATGVSSGSAHTVPRLLMPNKVSGWPLTELSSPKLVGTESVGGTICYKIESNGARQSTTAWIAKQSYLITKIVEKPKKLKVVETTVYQAKLNVKIPDSAFKSGIGK